MRLVALDPSRQAIGQRYQDEPQQAIAKAPSHEQDHQPGDSHREDRGRHQGHVLQLGIEPDNSRGTADEEEHGDAIEEALRTVARPLGAIVERTSRSSGSLAGDALVGDFVVEIPDLGRIVVEAKNVRSLALTGGESILGQLDRALELEHKTGDYREFSLRNYAVDFDNLDEVGSTDDSVYRVELLTPAQFHFATSLAGIDCQPKMLSAVADEATGHLAYSVNHGGQASLSEDGYVSAIKPMIEMIGVAMTQFLLVSHPRAESGMAANLRASRV